MFRPAWQEKCQSLGAAVSMTLRLADYYESIGDRENADRQIMQAKAMLNCVKDDITPPFWGRGIYESLSEFVEQTNQRLKA